MTHPLSVEEYFNVMKLSQDGRYSAAAAVAFLFVDIIWTLRDEASAGDFQGQRRE
ncbi:hypothetical protein CC2G_004230 [Coprinopsis cinerea AmutBmut pab1-1]|nr:hypothetical protein CC2G_004230 [Coprinopsis cinerea AmutBmut pab1-1]